MFEIGNLSLFLVAALVLTIAPGPDLVFLITQSVSCGPKAGFATAMGLGGGNLVHTLAAALGVSIIFQTSELAFTLLKIAGAVYLLYLAIKAFRSVSATQNSIDEANTVSGKSLFWRGVLMNILNPKVALFFLAFLPQFTRANSEPMWQQMLFLGAIFTLLVILVFGCVGLFAGAASQRFKGKGSFSKYANKAVGLVFVGLAARLLFVEQY